MLANSWVEFLHFHFARLIAFIFGGGVKMSGAGTGNQFDFISHDLLPLEFFAASAHFSNNGINAFFIDKAHAAGRNAQTNPAVFTGYPKAMMV